MSIITPVNVNVKNSLHQSMLLLFFLHVGPLSRKRVALRLPVTSCKLHTCHHWILSSLRWDVSLLLYFCISIFNIQSLALKRAAARWTRVFIGEEEGHGAASERNRRDVSYHYIVYFNRVISDYYIVYFNRVI